MKYIDVTSQAELEMAIRENGPDTIFRLLGNGQFKIGGSSHVEAWEWSHVEARGSSHVVARGSSHVEARDSSHVEARESSHVVARESSHVEAWGFAAVHRMPDHTGKSSGGVQIRVKYPTTAKAWCGFYGVRVKRGTATLFKAVRDDYRSAHGVFYTPGTTPKAEDWDGGKQECGGGLHFASDPVAAKTFDSEATRFVACPVKLSEIVVHKNPAYPYKVKAPRVFKPIWECDAYRKPIKAAGGTELK